MGLSKPKKTITRKITEKQNDFLDFIENELPFGKCLLIIHSGEPQRAEDKKPTRIFGKKSIDKPS